MLCTRVFFIIAVKFNCTYLYKNNGHKIRVFFFKGIHAPYCTTSLIPKHDGMLPWDPFSKRFFHHTSNSIKALFCSHPNSSKETTTTKFCTWHNGCTVVELTKFCRDIMVSKTNFPSILIFNGKSLAKWTPAAQGTPSTHTIYGVKHFK